MNYQYEPDDNAQFLIFQEKGLMRETHWVWDEALDKHEKATGKKE